ncbi:ATP-binding cassette domain-containing protein [Coriobacteriia bacterium Es71-Z0120]|uniref:ATP-binding cassette domain-containing protein n=1 Tax=Parvivirga hydrogeniphila TaxID=2939460 RepID=UPI0022608C6A|nr:ATP-binding cassette domain-containing protein [Parvivirga hydrogeniphila]MCL4078566.1 ATP-binding cassette domain-containing protein [Parvivirga hydrogeniphila]
MGLSAADIAVAYNRGTVAEQRALDGVSVQVERGEVVLVVGVTGSGKSTLLKVLAGLLAPGEGSVTIDGSPLPHPPASAVGIVFQNPERQLFGETVLEDVAFGPRMLGAPRPLEVAERALSRVGLDPEAFGARSPFSLSGGEARRVAIAGVLALGADYLLFDEPTVGLDGSGRRAVVDLIRRERQEHGVVVVTHHPDPFLALADRIVALRDGRVVFSGSVEDVVRAPGRYEATGLRLPELLWIQVEALRRGAPLKGVGSTPEEVGRLLLDARRRS